MLKQWIRLIKNSLLIIGVLLSFFAVLETIRAYQTLYELHPYCGYGFLFILILLGLYFSGSLAVTLMTRPPVLKPPKINNIEQVSVSKLKKYASYLLRYLARLTYNQTLNEEDLRLIGKYSSDLNAVISEITEKDRLLTSIRQCEDECIEPVLKKVDERAQRHVRTCMRDVMIAVTLSPYKAVDLFVVIYRNIAMVNRIIHVYNARPRFRDQMKIYTDILAVVATVNFINMGKNLIESLGNRVPGIGRFIDDIAQGMGAGFMTTIVGHATIDRCRAFRKWDQQAAKVTLKNKAVAFYADVRDIFKKDILPSMLKRIGSTSRDTVEKIGSVIDETQNRVTSYIKTPIKTAANATNNVVIAGGKITDYSLSKLQAMKNLFHKTPSE